MAANAGRASGFQSSAVGPAWLHSAFGDARMKVRVRESPVWLILFAFLLSGCSAARPLHRSEASIRASLLRKTAIGTSKQEVQAFITAEGWWSSPNKDGGIWAYFGRYGFLSDWRVSGLWTFDKNDRLVDIFVEKCINSL